MIIVVIAFNVLKVIIMLSFNYIIFFTIDDSCLGKYIYHVNKKFQFNNKKSLNKKIFISQLNNYNVVVLFFIS